MNFRGISNALSLTWRRLNSYHLSDTVFVLILLLASLSLNVFFGLRIRSASTPSAGRRVGVTGVTIPDILCSGIEGELHVVKFGGMNKPTVLYVFHPDCAWCTKNLENIRALAKARGDDFRFVGISLMGPELKAYVRQADMGFSVYAISSYAAVSNLELGSTPETVVVRPDGLVLKNWIGAFWGENAKEVEAYFDVKLPGVR